jgi:hypothetical protein
VEDDSVRDGLAEARVVVLDQRGAVQEAVEAEPHGGEEEHHAVPAGHLLAAEGRPRLLLVDPATAPPVCWDDQEDWLRLPADPTELAVRVATLRRRATMLWGTRGAPFSSMNTVGSPEP